MTAPYFHPERAALSGERQPGSNTNMSPSTDVATHQHGSATTRSNPEPLPPDLEAARKARINRELIDLLRLPAKGSASIQGIGLYTHAAASQSTNASNEQVSAPTFLPIGGPRRVLRDEAEIDAPISEDVRRVWEELRDAVNEEEKHVGRSGMSAEQLKERYGAMDVPAGYKETSKAPPHTQQQLQQAMEQLRRLRQGAMLSRDVAVSGTDEAGKTTATANQSSSTGTNTAPRGNEYHEERDPRKR